MKFDIVLAGKKIEVDFNNLAEQANGSVFVRSGGTVVLTTCVMSKNDIENRGFFPLTVEYEEKYYAAGRIKGSRYIKREGRPSDEAICNARLIDRAIRPVFPENLKREVQVISTVLSWDGENDPDILSLLGASLSLSVSDIPWKGPIGVIRVCWKNGKFIVNPTYQEKRESELDVVFSALSNQDGEILINMIEGQGNEVEEDLLVKAYDFGEEYLKQLIEFQKDISKKIGKEKVILIENDNSLLKEKIYQFLDDSQKLEKALFHKDKIIIDKNLRELKEELIKFLKENIKEDIEEKEIEEIFYKKIDEVVHKEVLKNNRRVDGRELDEIREISCEVGLLPRTHGSGLFCRGKTKALSILTLGAPGDEQLLEGMEIVGEKRYMHHYNFPPYCSGEVKPVRGPGRREIGHGALAEKALLPLVPSKEKFPYTIRIVTEILSSNGSTSMAAVCGSSLALMDAGVPIKRPAAGIAMGLMKDKNTGKYEILTDIQGPEDHHGDMDFKVAGTRKGMTAIQMDVKIEGINKQIMAEVLNRAKKARMEILDKMEKIIDKPRNRISPYAPKILTFQIDPERIGDVIGSGGKIINGIIKRTGATIDIQDDGLIYISAESEEKAKEALEFIHNIVREVKIGEVFEGEVRRILDFGALVEILPNREGLIHISKLSPNHIKKVEDVVKVGDKVLVKVISIDEQKRINLALIKNFSKKSSFSNFKKSVKTHNLNN